LYSEFEYNMPPRRSARKRHLIVDEPSSPLPPVFTDDPPVAPTPLPVEPSVVAPPIVAPPSVTLPSVAPPSVVCPTSTSIPHHSPSRTLNNNNQSQSSSSSSSSATLHSVMNNDKRKKGLERDKECRFRKYSVELGETRGHVGSYDYYKNVILRAKMKKLTPSELVVKEGFKVSILDKQGEFCLVTLRVPHTSGNSLQFMLLDTTDSHAEVFPVDIKLITSLTPSEEYNTSSSDQWFDTQKAAHQALIEKEHQLKIKKAKLYLSTSPSKSSPSPSSSSLPAIPVEQLKEVITIAMETVVQSSLSELQSLQKQQHAFFDEMEHKQRADFAVMLRDQKEYFKDLLHILRPH
jgi:hypothetical protein